MVSRLPSGSEVLGMSSIRSADTSLNASRTASIAPAMGTSSRRSWPVMTRNGTVSSIATRFGPPGPQPAHMTEVALNCLMGALRVVARDGIEQLQVLCGRSDKHVDGEVGEAVKRCLVA